MNQVVSTSSGYKLYKNSSQETENKPQLLNAPYSTSNNISPFVQVYKPHSSTSSSPSTSEQDNSILTCASIINNDQRKINSMSNNSVNVLLSGSVAGAISRTATAGFERLTIIQQVQGLCKDGPRYTGCIKGIKEMISKEGYLSLFKGNGANIVKVSPNSAIRFFTYEYCKGFYNGGDSTKKLSGTQSMGAGAMAGLTSTFATYPLDVIRTRLSLQGSSMSSDFGALRYKGICHGFVKIHSEEGIRGLYKGLGTATMSVAPWVSLSFASYEGFKSIVHKIIQQQEELKQQQLFSLPQNQQEINIKGRDMLVDLGCGAASGCVTMTVCYPLDVLRRRMMVQGIGENGKAIYRNGFHALKSIVKEEGIASLYLGIVPAYFKVVPTVAISFAVYELCKGMLSNEEK